MERGHTHKHVLFSPCLTQVQLFAYVADTACTMLCDVMWHLYWWVNGPGMAEQTSFCAVLHVIMVTLARQAQGELGKNMNSTLWLFS